jgi:hypothetical protein
VWLLSFHKDAEGINLGIGRQDRALRIFNMRPFKRLFSNPAGLEREAEAQSGLTTAGNSDEPQVSTIPTAPASTRPRRRPFTETWEIGPDDAVELDCRDVDETRRHQSHRVII